VNVCVAPPANVAVDGETVIVVKTGTLALVTLIDDTDAVLPVSAITAKIVSDSSIKAIIFLKPFKFITIFISSI
jgi:hypothetical protein